MISVTGAGNQLDVELNGDQLRTSLASVSSIRILIHRGNDEIRAAGFGLPPMQLDGGAGNDRFVLPRYQDRVTGGLGDDRVEFTGDDLRIELTAGAERRMSGIEHIDATQSGRLQLVLDSTTVAALHEPGGALYLQTAGDAEVDLRDPWSLTQARGVDEVFYQQLESGEAVLWKSGPQHWQNSADPRDVNGDGWVTPLDVLVVINELNHRQYTDASRKLVDPSNLVPFPMHFVDVDGNGHATPLDALHLVNHLNRESGGEGEPRQAHYAGAVDFLFGDMMMDDDEWCTPNPAGRRVRSWHH